MSCLQLGIVLLFCLPLAVTTSLHFARLGQPHPTTDGAACLTCYTCMFPAISPLDCFKFPQECPVGQRCLSSTATGRRGSLEVTMYEKSCAVPAQCGLSGQKYASGLYFNFTNVCCDSDLCNAAGTFTALSWRGAALCLLPALCLLLA
ncbi:prostate stem cell antigen-like isoform X1 [Notothenia coriiceps]|uniref:Prostate stem cell antigen-like isoform X1 n=1 Tax=Notothenia coriiceps TaxID=8208 RepID=A0A6I9NS40_9TELE|nr:PREDICTED: prostate stem cell antigen-like isoform X1 [Notothenia coriiceps]